MVEGGLNHLFETFSVPSLIAEIDTRNAASIRLVESLGFSQILERKDADFLRGKRVTSSLTI